MRTKEELVVTLVTAPDLKTARKLARAALEARLVACANLIPKVESHYWWQGKIERAAELLIMFKTSSRKTRALEQMVLAQHPYDTPEFIVLKLTRGNQRYLNWIAKSVR